MEEIKKTDFHEFDEMIDEFIYENTPQEHRYKKELTQSQKNMIEYYKKNIKDKKVK